VGPTRQRRRRHLPREGKRRRLPFSSVARIPSRSLPSILGAAFVLYNPAAYTSPRLPRRTAAADGPDQTTMVQLWPFSKEPLYFLQIEPAVLRQIQNPNFIYFNSKIHLSIYRFATALVLCIKSSF